MAAPSYVNASTGTTDSMGAWSHTCAAPAAAGNVMICQFLADGTNAGVPTISSITNVVGLDGSAGGFTRITAAGGEDVGSAKAASQHLYIWRSASTSAPVITGANSGGDDVYVRVYEFTNVNAGTLLTDVIENVTTGAIVNSPGTSNTAADASVTTIGPDRLALNFVAVNDDNAISAFTGETGGDWTLAVAPYADSGGTDGAIGLQIAETWDASVSYIVGDTAWVVGVVYGGSGTHEMFAQSFLAPVDAATHFYASIRFAKTGAPADNIVVELQSDASNLPSGAVLASDSKAATGIANLTNQTFALASPITSGTKYWLVVSRSGARDTGNFLQVTQSNGDYANGTNSVRASGTWRAETSPDASFSLQVPTTATIDGGSGSIVDSDAWGVVGFALIGTTPMPPTELHRNPAVTFYDPAVLMQPQRERIWLPRFRRPELWLPKRVGSPA